MLNQQSNATMHEHTDTAQLLDKERKSSKKVHVVKLITNVITKLLY